MITENRDLRTGRPVWAEYKRSRIPSTALSHALETDVLVIGAGISGAMIAEALTSEGFAVAIVDKRKPLSGSTSASTALVQFSIDVPLTHLIKKIGQERAVRAWRRSKLAVESLAAKIRLLDINCDFSRRDSFYLSGSLLPPAELEEECRRRNLVGLPGEMSTAKELRSRGIKGTCAIKSLDDFAVNPVQMAEGFLKVAIRNGAKLYTPVEIEHLIHKKNHIALKTSEGITIKARHIVFATGYEMPLFVPAQKHKIQSTWAIASKPMRGMPEDFPHVWEAADPYLYARGHDGRIIMGGEDEPFSDSDKRDALISEKTRILERKLRKMFPDFDPVIDHAWAGSFGSSSTGLPSIGHIPGMARCYGAMAYGGNGITFSRIAAELITMQICGQHDPDEKVFAFGR